MEGLFTAIPMTSIYTSILWIMYLFGGYETKLCHKICIIWYRENTVYSTGNLKFQIFSIFQVGNNYTLKEDTMYHSSCLSFCPDQCNLGWNFLNHVNGTDLRWTPDSQAKIQCGRMFGFPDVSLYSSSKFNRFYFFPKWFSNVFLFHFSYSDNDRPNCYNETSR